MFADYELLFDEYYDKIFAYIACRVNNYGDAEDLTADVFLKAFSHPYNPNLAKFSTYIFAIASNALKDYYRARSRRAALFTGNEPDENLPDETDVIGEVLTRLEYSELQKALASLPRRQYEAVFRRYYLEQSFKEIGAALRISEDGAKKLHSRALEALKNYLQRASLF